MSKYILIIILLQIITYSSCSSRKQTDRLDSCGELLKENLKIEVFATCVGYSYKLNGKDLSTPNSIQYGFETYRKLDSLANIVIEEIIQDSIDRTYKKWGEVNWETDSLFVNNLYNEGMIGPRTMHYCLDYYNSVELDSITKIMACDIERSWD